MSVRLDVPRHLNFPSSKLTLSSPPCLFFLGPWAHWWYSKPPITQVTLGTLLTSISSICTLLSISLPLSLAAYPLLPRPLPQPFNWCSLTLNLFPSVELHCVDTLQPSCLATFGPAAWSPLFTCVTWVQLKPLSCLYRPLQGPTPAPSPPASHSGDNLSPNCLSLWVWLRVVIRSQEQRTGEHHPEKHLELAGGFACRHTVLMLG